jgi:PAS domain S-box-containing protein
MQFMEGEGCRALRYYALVLESVGEGICGLDVDGMITFANPAAASALRTGPEALVGRGIHDVVHAGEHPAHGHAECGLVRAVREGRRHAGRDRFRRTTGGLFPVEFSVAVLADEQIEGGVLSFHDATEQRRSEEGLHESLTALAATSAQRDRLLEWLTEAQREERQRIAADVHDDTVQAMGAVALRLEHARLRLSDPGEVALIGRLLTTVRTATDRLRVLLFQLAPPDLDADLGRAIAFDAEHVSDLASFRHVLCDRLERQPSRARRETLFRMSHELLVNVRKHADATLVTTTLASPADGFMLRVEDDGVGIETERLRNDDPQHAGLRLLGDRVALAGGRWRIGAREGGGTMVEIWLPAEDVLR